MPIHEVCVYLRSKNAAEAIDFYVKAFGAIEQFRLTDPDGRVGHAELAFGDHIIMIADEFPDYGVHAPSGTAEVGISLSVDDADAHIEKAVAAGAKPVQPPTDQFYGERAGKVLDPSGYEWMISHSIEDVAPEEMQRRFSAMFEGGES